MRSRTLLHCLATACALTGAPAFAKGTASAWEGHWDDNEHGRLEISGCDWGGCGFHVVVVSEVEYVGGHPSCEAEGRFWTSRSKAVFRPDPDDGVPSADCAVVLERTPEGTIEVGTEGECRLCGVNTALFGVFVRKSPPARASFDCAKARSGTEKAVCSNGDLATLDSKLASVFSAFRKAPGLDSGQLVDSQRKWIVARDAECASHENFTACLLKLYFERISALPRALDSCHLGDCRVPAATVNGSAN